MLIKQALKNKTEWIRYGLVVLFFLLIQVMSSELPEVEKLFENGEIRRLFTFKIIGSSIILLGICFIVSGMKGDAFKTFLVLFPSAMILYCIVFPVGRVPDEQNHIRQIYLLSTGQILPANNGRFMLPVNLLEDGLLNKNLTIRDLSGLAKESISSELAEYYLDATAIYPPAAYLPQALVLLVVRLLTGNAFAVLYSARLGGMAFTFGLFAAAICYMPGEKNKQLLLLISLIPMCLQEAMSAAVDGASIGAVMLMISYVKYLTEKRIQIGTKQFVILLLTAIGLVSFKTMYFPFILLIFAIPKECFISCSRRKTILTILGISFGMLLCWWILYRTCASGNSERTASIAGNIRSIILHPVGSLKMIYRTIRDGIVSWPYSMTGQRLAWMNISVPLQIIYVFLFVLFAAWIREKPQRPFTNLQRTTLICTVISFAVIMLFLWIWWTPKDSATIEGIQGRYFIPLLAPILTMGIENTDESDEKEIVSFKSAAILFLR